MAKSSRQRKLQMLKKIAASQKYADNLVQEQRLNVVQTKLMEIELEQMKMHLQTLEERRDALLHRSKELESQIDETGSDQSE